MFDRFEEFHKVFLFFYLSELNKKYLGIHTAELEVMRGQKDENELNKHLYIIITFENLCM